METNVIYCGDCRKVMMNHIPDESVDLIYLDPPFFSNKKYEVIWGDGYEIRSFEDRWKGGIENYRAWMEDKLRECHRVLKPTGSMYLHCDWHANAHLRILMDDIFGHNNFRNEIVWCYTIGGKSKKMFGRKHDTIFFYTKSNKWKFNGDAITISRPKTHMKMRKDSKGKWYQEKTDKKTGKVYKYYVDKGKIPEDYWIDIETINREAKERLGYPTQKPEPLLERIIKASSNRKNIVLDPMCGCGTAIAVAQKLGRKWIGIDVSPTACKLMVKRMKSIRIGKSKGKRVVDVKIIGLPKTLREIKNMQPFIFQNWVCEKLIARPSRKKVGDMGIDGRLFDGTPIQVKQSEHVGRNVVDNFETAIRRERKKKGMIIAFSFGKGAYEEVARAKNKDGLDIELKTVKEIMDEV